ncbi:MAG: polyphosphate polymerase domain-containing protein [bacterium]
MGKPAKNNSLSRYERKFVVTREYKSSIYYLLSVHPSLFREIYRQRKINNIYFDSIDYKFYRENVAGIANRKKVRLRWYGEMYGQIQATLEIKSKHGLTGTKQSFLLPSFNFTDQTNIMDIKKLLLQSTIPELIRQELFTLEMTLLNRYERRYFLSFDKKFRVTVDDSLNYFRIDNNTNISESFMTVDPNTILELKYDYQHDVDAHYISNQFPFRVSRNSKYISGIEFIRL